LKWPSALGGGVVNSVIDSAHAAVLASGGGSIGVPTATLTLDANYSANTDATTAGSGNAHNNTQPTLILNKIIKL
jgi:microcystin-dependent protein